VIAVVRWQADESVFAFENSEGWMFTASFPGLFAVYVGISMYPYLGVSGIAICSTAGQLVMSLLMDNYGVLGFERKAATPLRITGVVLVCIAAVVMQLYKANSTQSKPPSVVKNSDSESVPLLHEQSKDGDSNVHQESITIAAKTSSSSSTSV
jgi:hypothetical protein